MNKIVAFFCSTETTLLGFLTMGLSRPLFGLDFLFLGTLVAIVSFTNKLIREKRKYGKSVTPL